MQIQFIVYILTLIIATALVCGTKPQMHKRAVILDYKYKVVDTVQPVIQQPEIVPQVDYTKQEEIKVSPKPQTVPVQTVIPQQPVKVQQAKTETKPQTVKTVSTPKVQPVQTQTQTPKPQQTVKPEPVKQKQPEKKVETPKVQPQSAPAPTKVVLTPQQETILWNKWRSDLQNKIMDTANLPLLPQGIVFRFSFNVDKNGRITNIKSWSENPKYTPYAIQYITPAIRNLQGKNILKFPEGSNRENTTFEGNIRISNTSKYSSSSDYNDVEKIKH